MPDPFAMLGQAAQVAAQRLASIDPWTALESLADPNRYEFYFGFMAIAAGTYLAMQANGARRTRAAKLAAEEAGLSEPPSLHPVIDPTRCIGCGACVAACPEGKVIGLIDKKAELIEPANCIGHGACKTACPADAIDLVFGTATRGVEIPRISPDFETNVPGIFVAGELGGMGLIANAVEQGRQAVDAIARRTHATPSGAVPLDIVIVGAGPAGISASLAARQHGLRALTIEQESFGGTVAHYPRSKIVMTRPANLPLFGKVRFRKVRKDRLLALWSRVVEQHRLPIHYGERVDHIVPSPSGFGVATSHNRYHARTVLLANGRRGAPRKLGVPGETLPKVVYRLIDRTQYRGAQVLVVGGGDSALETAIALAAEPSVTVTLSYRGAAFDRARARNRKRLETAVNSGTIQLLLESTVTAIHENHVDLAWRGRQVRIENQGVIVCAGGVLPGDFLRSIGVEIETKYGVA